MNVQAGWSEDSVAKSGMFATFWLDGGDEQEDELDDVAADKLQPPPTPDEVPGDVFESNKIDVDLEIEDENAGYVHKDEPSDDGRL